MSDNVGFYYHEFGLAARDIATMRATGVDASLAHRAEKTYDDDDYTGDKQ